MSGQEERQRRMPSVDSDRDLGLKGPLKVRMGPANFSGRKRNPGNFPGFNGQGGPNRRAAMAEHAADGKTRSPTGLLRSARDLHFNIPTF